MGSINLIEQTINNTIPVYGHVKLFPRGIPNFADSSLRGTVRFAKRSGNNIAVINPDNNYLFEQPPQTGANTFTLANLNNWIVEDCILSMGPNRELQQVYDIVDETVLLTNNLTQVYSDTDTVVLHAYPMLMSVDTKVGDTTIIVKSRYNIANGDVFVYLQSQNLIQSLTEIDIVTATQIGVIKNVFYDLLYALELKNPIPQVITSNAIVYLRAYPAYFSASVQVPNALYTSMPIGPFLIDILSSKLTEGTEFNETFAIRTLNRNNDYTLGSATSYVTVDKNYVILDRSTPVHAPMFWELAEGAMRLTPTKIVLNVGSNIVFDNTGLVPFQYDPTTGVVTYQGSVNLDAADIGDIFQDSNGLEYKIIDINETKSYIVILTQGDQIPSSIFNTVTTHLDGSIRKISDNKFCAGIKCIPPLPTNHSWRVSLRSNETCSIRFIFYPNLPQEFELLPNVSQNVTITIDGNPVTSIEINILSRANTCHVTMSEWSPVHDTVEQIQYSFVSQAVGISVYQATGLIIKPYFMGSEFLGTTYDTGATYDSGKIYF